MTARIESLGHMQPKVKSIRGDQQIARLKYAADA